MNARSKLIYAAVAIGAIMSTSSIASAATCVGAGYGGADITSRLNADGATTNSGCEVGTTTSPHSPNPQSRANADALFGVTNWILISNPLSSPNSTAGTYNLNAVIANFFTIYDKALFMFQAADPSDSLPENYVAYMLTAANGAAGSWTSPFDNEDWWERDWYGKYYNKVAYIKLLGQLKPPGGPSPVPLPAPFLLLGLALAGLGFGKWWKSRRTMQRTMRTA